MAIGCAVCDIEVDVEVYVIGGGCLKLVRR